VQSRLKFTPKSKVRQVNWTKIDATNLAPTFWNSITDDEVLQKQLDWEELESNFSIQVTKAKDKAQVDAPKTISLLDSKKSYNISIMISRIKMSFPDVRKAILNMSEELLPESLLKQLLQYVPTTEETALLMENLDNYDILGAPEQFYVEVRHS
jgi:hypothetical protein